MLEAAKIQPEDRILEIGVGSGYAAAVLSRIARRVHATDRQAELTDLARGRMAHLASDNSVIRSGDGTQAWPQTRPLDAILVAPPAPPLPAPLPRHSALCARSPLPGRAPAKQ